MVERPTQGAMGDERYRLLVEAITDYAIFMLDPSGVVASWNPGARRFKGYEAHEVIGSHFSRFYTPDDQEAGAPAKALATAEREGRYEDEGWRIRKDGTRFWTHVVIDPIRSPDGELLGFAKITRDLTERRASELALKQSEERFRMLVQSVTDYAIYMLDAQGYVSNWNAGAHRIKQYEEAEIVGQHFSRFYTEDDRANGEPARALKTARTQGRYAKEGWRVRKDGTEFWASVVIDPIFDDQRNVIGFAKVTRDITERLEAQRALEAAREAFFQAQKMEAIGQLTGGIAHDFNNLLSAVLGSLELLRKRVPNDPRALRLLDNAEQGAKRGAMLTQRMLAFARRQDLKTEATDLYRLVTDLSDLLNQTLGTGAVIEFAVPPNLPFANTDPNQLELAILNLVVNARDAMPQGGVIRLAATEVTLLLGESNDLPAGQYLCLAVSDTGEGMSAEQLTRAVEPFYTTKGIGKGTGLGLSMVQGLAEQLGGRLRLFSERGKGTTAELWLPATSASPQPRAIAEKDNVRNTGSHRILIVDDDILIRMNTVDMLEDLGHVVVEAAHAHDALNLLRQEAFDLMITDHAMPGLTGAELAEIVHVDKPNMPIILSTGYTDLPIGVASTLPRLSKPYSQTDLQKAVAKALGASAC